MTHSLCTTTISEFLISSSNVWNEVTKAKLHKRIKAEEICYACAWKLRKMMMKPDLIAEAEKVFRVSPPESGFQQVEQ